MSIVAISPTIGSLGDEIGREVARARGYEFADREIIEKAAARFGEGVMQLAHVTEEKPTLWERFVDTSRRYMTYVEAIVLELASRDDVVLAGRGAAFLLGSTRHVLRVRITAPERMRANRLVQLQGLSPRPRKPWCARVTTSSARASGISTTWTGTIRSSTTSSSTPIG